jgi:Family of unknown function (DUF6174)
MRCRRVHCGRETTVESYLRSPVSSVRSNHRWVWFFVALVVLTVAAIATLIIYNSRQLLKPEKLQAARALWQEHGPRGYDFDYTVKTQDNDLQQYAVKVRGGKVTAVTLNERPLEPAQLHYHSMAALFDDIETFLDRDSQPGVPRTFTRGDFAPDDGHLIAYVRRVMGSRERVEINVIRFEPIAVAKN